MRASWAFLVFIGIPLLEIYLFIAIGSSIGALTTIVLVVLTAVVGVSLIRIQGWSTLARARKRLLAGEPPAVEAAEGIILLIAAIMLLIPGFATDTLGFLLLIPSIRIKIIQRIFRTTGVSRGSNGSRGNSGSRGNMASSPSKNDKSGRVIEGEYEEHK